MTIAFFFLVCFWVFLAAAAAAAEVAVVGLISDGGHVVRWYPT